MSVSVLWPASSIRLVLLSLATCLTACVAEQEPTPQGAVADVGLDADQAAPDGGLLLPDAAYASNSAPRAADETSELTTLAEFRGEVTADGAMVITTLDPAASSDPALRRLAQGLCSLSIVQDGVPGSGPANSLELVTGTTGLDGACEGFLASPLFCGAVTVRSFYTSPQTQLFAQIQSLVPSTGFGVQNGDVVPGASSGLGSWAYGDLGAASSAPANAGVRNWVFARSGGNFTFTGRVVANVTELCDGLDNDCDGATDEGIGCRTQGQSCAATLDCSGTLVCTASICSLAGCPSGEHLESSACVSDTRSCSAPIASAATQTWTGSEYGPCVPTVCAASYHVEDGACVNDVQTCTIAGGTGTETWNSGTGSYGPCTLTACNFRYHANGNACDDDIIDCTINNGRGLQYWDGVSAYDACIAMDCDANYHLEDGACVSDTQSCTITNGTGFKIWSSASDDYGSCTRDSCNNGYHANLNVCDADVISCSPLPSNTTAGTQVWDGVSAYGSCTASACASGYSVVGGVCVLQSILGTACTLNAECASGFCATGPTGTVNDRCAPEAMNYIPAGTFFMGSPFGELGRVADETQHTVTLSRSFFMGQTEITQGQWKALSGGLNPSWTQNTTCAYGECASNENANDSGPAEQLDWYAAVAFANARSAAEGLTACYTLTGCTDAANGWKDGIHSGCTGATFSGLTCTGYRLPTESEWEYAARAGTTTATYGGNLSAEYGCVTLSGTGGFAAGTALGSLAWYDCNASGRSQAVGFKAANSFGLYDMLGNVWEWTGDWYGTYPGNVTDPLGAGTGPYRVTRGGSWYRFARNARAAIRSGDTPGNRIDYLGFRLARTITRSCTTALPANATAGVEAGNASGWGACEATACATSYHVEGGACVSDTRSCSPMPANTTAGTQTWNSGTSAYGTCTASACLPDYSVVAGACIGSLGAACTANIECASGFCATGPDGTANDRCAPTGMNYIPAGTFTMGSPVDEVGRYTDETQHAVTLSRSFFMGQTEVTQGQWKALSDGINPSCFQSTTGTTCTTSDANDSGPVEKIDWYSAVAFANAKSAAEGLTSCYTFTGCTAPLDGWQDGIHSGCTGATLSALTCTGYRLPTESEREYAARGGTETATYLGNLSGSVLDCTTAQANLDGIAWWCLNSENRTQAVGGKMANSFGLYDMLGNAREWTGDWYNATYPGTVTDPTGPTTGSARVIRGGSSDLNARAVRASNRRIGGPAFRGNFLGFRLSRTVTRGCASLPANATAGVEAGNAGGWGACEATACATSYHVEGGACVSDTRSCSPMPANTTAGTQTWNSGTSSYGSCTASACLPDYSVVAGACIGSLGAACTLNAECASGFCATGPDGTANDRCAPEAMNYIPAGTFTMGSPATEVGRISTETQHSVTLSRAFFMSQTEVTQGQWKALSGGLNPSYFQNTTCAYGGCASTENANDSGPVEYLDWYAAVAFANARSASEGLTSCYTLTGCADAANGWKDGIHSSCTGATFAGLTCTGYRLPTESEWEYAARGGTTAATYLGNLIGGVDDCSTAQANLDGIAWWCRNSGNRTKAVGGKTANSFGLSDMLGNVYEWTGDWYGNYPAVSVTDPLGPSTGSGRVLRGGSWFISAHGARAAFRSDGAPPGLRSSALGFRLSRTAP